MGRKRLSETTPPDPAAYRAPALEKGLDILELLSAQAGGLILSQIAHSLDRSVQEVYRVVLSLERRGYVERRQPGDAYFLTIKLFDLASKHPPAQRLLEAGQTVLPALASETTEAVIMSVLDGAGTRVIMVADNPAPVGIKVRLGTQAKLLGSASGRTLFAFQEAEMQRALLKQVAPQYRGRKPELDRHLQRVARIAARGYEVMSDETLKGVTDVSFPIVDGTGRALAALTMPFLPWASGRLELTEASGRLLEAARHLCRQVGGQLPVTSFTLD